MDPVTLQVMANALRAVAEEMEAALVRSAFSPNIKERRDCSTAIFDGAGRMVVQSASIPVHLGAMPEAVAAVRERGAAPGEVWLVNDPYRGGTHLPDLTMISPAAAGRRDRRLRRHPRPPRRRRRDGARQHAGRLARAAAGGPGHPAGAARARRRAGARRAGAGAGQHPHARASARATCGPSSPRTAWPSARLAEVAARHGAGPGAGGLRRAARLRRAAHPRRDRRDARRPLRGRRGPRGRRRDRRRPLDPRGGHDRRRRHAGGLHRHRPGRARATATARRPSPARPSTSWCAA